MYNGLVATFWTRGRCPAAPPQAQKKRPWRFVTGAKAPSTVNLGVRTFWVFDGAELRIDRSESESLRVGEIHRYRSNLLTANTNAAPVAQVFAIAA